jgi:hypothetical protein
VSGELENLYKKLQETTLDMYQFEGVMFDVAFEMTSVDSYLAGIADTIVDGLPVRKSVLGGLDEPWLIDKKYWLLERESKIDLSSYAELLEFALLLEDLRVKCLDHLKES